MHIMKYGARLEAMVFFITSHSYNRHIFNERQWCIMLWRTGDLYDHLNHVDINNKIARIKVHNESIKIVINGERVNVYVELGYQIGAIIHITLLIVVY